MPDCDNPTVILRCTAKLLGMLGTNPRDLALAEPTDDDWYADLLWVQRRKCLLLTHAGTLLSIFVPDVRKTDVAPAGPLIVGRIAEALMGEGLPASTLGRLDASDVHVAKTASRQVLGCMRTDAQAIEWAVAHDGGLVRCDVAALNRELRRTLHLPKGRGAVFPLDLARERAQQLRTE